MQIMLIIILAVGLVATILYKVNEKFETREFIILIAILILGALATTFFIEDKKQEVPEIFKAKYEKENGVKISKFTFKRLNNKVVSSKSNFIYDFDYIILKDGIEFVCSAKDVKIKKIEDEYIFENFSNLKEECTPK